MNLRQAAQQALEALALLQGDIEWTSNSPTLKFVNSTVAALRAAIAEPETEVETYKRLYELRGKALDRPCSNCGYQPERIYPMAVAEPEQEPVGQLQEEAYGRGQVLWFKKPADQSMLYAAPTRRRPVELTDEEIASIVGECAASAHRHDDFSFARAVIAAYEKKQGEQT